MLLSLIGELPISTGHLNIQGRTLYASQDAWIFPGTIQENIVMKKSFDESRYNNILEICGLQEDLQEFPKGDVTRITEQSLSGGQKARINLARVLYEQEAHIYLLDDPLSSVDAKVRHHIFERCIKSHLKQRLVVLATHQLQFLPQADYIVVLSEVRFFDQFSFLKLIKSIQLYNNLI